MEQVSSCIDWRNSRVRIDLRPGCVKHCHRIYCKAFCEESSYTSGQSGGAGGSPDPGVRQFYDRMPFRFEVNCGQASKDVKYLCRQNQCLLFLTETEAIFFSQAVA